MKITVENVSALQRGMRQFDSIVAHDLMNGDNEVFVVTVRDVLLDGALGAFGYTFKYHVPENNRSRDITGYRELWNAALATWVSIRKFVDEWLIYQSYSRSSENNDWIAHNRRKFEPRLDKLEDELRHIIEFCGDSVDKPGR